MGKKQAFCVVGIAHLCRRWCRLVSGLVGEEPPIAKELVCVAYVGGEAGEGEGEVGGIRRRGQRRLVGGVRGNREVAEGEGVAIVELGGGGRREKCRGHFGKRRGILGGGRGEWLLLHRWRYAAGERSVFKGRGKSA